jgi:hypothetical protein
MWFIPSGGFAGRSQILAIDLELEDGAGPDHIFVSGQGSSLQNYKAFLQFYFFWGPFCNCTGGALMNLALSGALHPSPFKKNLQKNNKIKQGFNMYI